MRVPLSGLRIDSPAVPLLLAQVSYQGVTDVIGNVGGTTLQDTMCSTAGLQPGYDGLQIKLLSSNAAGQVRPINVHTIATGVISVLDPWTDFNGAAYQIPVGTRFVILSNQGGGGAPAPVLAPSIGLWMFGECDPAMVASTTAITCPNLIGFPDDIFNDEFWMQVIHNTDAPGTAPEREWSRITNYVGATGAFTTDAFSANVEASDLVAIVHESIMSMEILGFGTLDTSSATVPADSTRAAAYTWENNDFFKGCVLMPTEGDCRFQPRPIRTYASATGVFTLDEPFTQVPGLVDYVIIRSSYPVQRLIDIFNLVNAMLVTTETSGTITTDGTVQNVYINNAPGGVFEPLCVKLDLSNMIAGHQLAVVVNYQIRPGGALTRAEGVTFLGAQTDDIITIQLDPNRYGIQVTLDLLAGANIDIDWEVIYRV